MALLKFQDFLFELGDGSAKGYDWKDLGYTSGPHDAMGYKYQFDADGLKYVVFFNHRQDSEYGLSFGIGDEIDVETQTNKGNQFKIMATVVDIMFAFADQLNPDAIRFAGSSSGDEESFHSVTQRTKFYREYVKKQLPEDYEMIDQENTTIIQKIR